MSDRYFSVNLQVTTKTTNSFNDSFDLKDFDKWRLLRSHASKVLKKSALARFPKDPSQDPKLWFELYRFLPQDLFENQDEDLGSDQPNKIYLVLSEDDEEIDTFSSE
jgi:hypothetical protein